MPPKPGITWEASLVLRSRLIRLSTKSAKTPPNPMITPKAIDARVQQRGVFGKNLVHIKAIPAENKIPPTKPSQVFLGLSKGVIRCLPKSLPVK